MSTLNDWSVCIYKCNIEMSEYSQIVIMNNVMCNIIYISFSIQIRFNSIACGSTVSLYFPFSEFIQFQFCGFMARFSIYTISFTQTYTNGSGW